MASLKGQLSRTFGCRGQVLLQPTCQRLSTCTALRAELGLEASSPNADLLPSPCPVAVGLLKVDDDVDEVG